MPFSLTAFSTDAVAWADRIAVRLCSLQASLADDAPAMRREYLVDEIEREIKGVDQGLRSAYLNALETRFPGFAAEPEEGVAPTAAQEWTVEDALQKLVVEAPGFSPEMKVVIAQKLQAAGIFPPSPHAGVTLAAESMQKLGLAAHQEISAERLGRLFGSLVEVISTLDNLIWNVWKTAAPRSIYRRDRPGDMRKTLGIYLTGDAELSTTEVQQMLEKTRQLIAAILSALGPAGETYARHHLQTFAPEKIRAATESGAGFLGGNEQKFWRKYVELSDKLNGPAVERQILDAIVKYAEDLLLGSGRRPES